MLLPSCKDFLMLTHILQKVPRKLRRYHKCRHSRLLCSESNWKLQYIWTLIICFTSWGLYLDVSHWTSIFQNVSLNSARKLPKFLLKTMIQGWGRLEKMAQWLREVTALAKDLDSLTTDSNHLQLQFQGI